MQRGASQKRRYLGYEAILKKLSEGKMKVTVPNETFMPNKVHLFHSFVQYTRIYTCIGSFQEGFDTRHRFDTEIQHTRLYLYIEWETK